ncbi:MAG: hypothetical protein MI923_03015 [Phycisphaerales bacterium]|nr:hypothetical protein [Phycisphaerales bacterium]
MKKQSGSGWWIIALIVGGLLWMSGRESSSPEPNTAPSYSTPHSTYSPNNYVSPTARRGVAENKSYYGQPNADGRPKTVRVKGYYRKDGTYVRGHYRSRPR